MNSEKKQFILIDDDPTFNFIHQKIVGLSSCAGDTLVFSSAAEALNYFEAEHENADSECIILLDINMPVINGFEFLQKYEKLPVVNKRQINIYMLSSSLNPDDRAKSKQFAVVSGFLNKPLSATDVCKLCVGGA